MKKILLSMAVLGIIGTANAQKLALIEEFTGENCGPCASLNPGFMSLIETPGNETKVLLLKYQSPIPSPGSIYDENTVFTDARMEYYGVPFAPYGRINGNYQFGQNNSQAQQNGNVGSIGYATQSDIDNAALEDSNFTMSISAPVYSNNGQSFSATVTVTATAATTESNTRLRIVLAEELDYDSAPGTNGETHFQNVVRQMYPNAEGQLIDENWTANQTRTYTITGAIPSYVNDNPPSAFLAAFLQDDTTMEVLQATRTDGDIDIEKADLDVEVSNLQIQSNLICELPASIDGTTVNVKNTAGTTINSFDVLYKLSYEDNWNTEPWTGTLEENGSVEVTLPNIALAEGSGALNIEVKVDNLNGLVDYNDYDNLVSSALSIIGEDDFPASYDAESNSENWYPFVENQNQYPLVRVWSGDSNQPIGHNGSTWSLYYPSYYLPTGTRGYFMLPKVDLPEGEKSLNFYLSYAVRGGTQGDKLEVLSSADCGVTWDVIWEAQGNDLATTDPTGSTTLHIPNSNTWELISVDISEMTSDHIFSFRATSGGSNYLFIDDIEFTNPASIDKVIDLSELKLFPNPTTDILNVSLTMKMSENVNFTVINSIGQEVISTSERLNEGNQQATLNVSDLASGVYILNIHTEGGTTQRKFVKK